MIAGFLCFLQRYSAQVHSVSGLTQGVVEGDGVHTHPVAGLDDHHPFRSVEREDCSSAVGWAVRLPDWRYPVVCDVATSKVAFDNYGGRWGDQKQLDRFFQAYAVEKAGIEARRKGHTITEQSLADGSIKLTIQVGGAS